MKTIPLSQGRVALIDDSDYERVSAFKWYALKIGRNWYAVRNIKTPDGARTTQYLHRFLMPESKYLHHRDSNGLNDQRNNLQPVSNQQNHWTLRRKKADTSSKFRGVTWCKKNQKWIVHIVVNYRQIFLGYFFKEAEAARAYDNAAHKYYGEFAAPNFA